MRQLLSGQPGAQPNGGGRQSGAVVGPDQPVAGRVEDQDGQVVVPPYTRPGWLLQIALKARVVPRPKRVGISRPIRRGFRLRCRCERGRFPNRQRQPENLHGVAATSNRPSVRTQSVNDGPGAAKDRMDILSTRRSGAGHGFKE